MSRDPLGLDWAVNQLDPCDRLAPENAGLRVWLLALPEGMGGAAWRDLMGGGAATLNTPASMWGPTTRPGGSGEVRFNASSNQVDIPAAPLGGHENGFTFSCQIYRTTTTNYTCVYTDTGMVSGSGSLALFLQQVTDGYIYLGTVNAACSYSPAFTTGEWQFLAATYDGTTFLTYRNGVQNSSTALGGGSRDYTATGISMGLTGAGGSRLPGMMDDVRIYPRCLSAAEVATLYDRSRRGYPPC